MEMVDQQINPSRSNRHGADLQDPVQLDLWIQDLWRRLDRDKSGTITREELEVEAFHEVIRSAVAPNRASSGGATHSRAELNMRDAIQFCMRKADQNSDASLSWPEFRSLVGCLLDPNTGAADLAFALFDLDSSQRIDRQEFHELLRFFLGRNATATEFQDEWVRLIAGHDNVSDATRQQYMKWLGKTPIPEIRQHAPKKGGTGMLARNQADRPKWTKRLNTGPNPGHLNDTLPQGQRAFFSRPQSLPELSRFYDNFAHTDTFKRHVEGLSAEPPERATSSRFPKCLSSEGGTPLTLPGRHSPDGTMLDHRTGRPAIWEDNFVVAQRFTKRYRASDRPLPPRATFPELQDDLSKSQSSGFLKKTGASFRSSASSTWHASADRRSASAAALSNTRRHRIRPSRDTTMSPIGWSDVGQ